MIEDSRTVLEREPLEKLAENRQRLMAYRHSGFWHAMDTKRDRDNLEKIWLTTDPSMENVNCTNRLLVIGGTGFYWLPFT